MGRCLICDVKKLEELFENKEINEELKKDIICAICGFLLNENINIKKENPNQTLENEKNELLAGAIQAGQIARRE